MGALGQAPSRAECWSKPLPCPNSAPASLHPDGKGTALKSETLHQPGQVAVACWWWPSPRPRPPALAVSRKTSPELLRHRCRRAGVTVLHWETADLWCKTNRFLLSKRDAACRNGYFGLGFFYYFNGF